MSADNWAVCPRCVVISGQEFKKTEEALAADYGSIDPADFLRRAAEIEAKRDQPMERTFREDYEFYGIEDGTVHAVYSGGCQKCDLRVKFDHAVPVDIGGGS